MQKPYPITNSAGKLFCMAESVSDGSDIILRGKNCEISLNELKNHIMTWLSRGSRNKKSDSGKAPA